MENWKKQLKKVKQNISGQKVLFESGKSLQGKNGYEKVI